MIFFPVHYSALILVCLSTVRYFYSSSCYYPNKNEAATAAFYNDRVYFRLVTKEASLISRILEVLPPSNANGTAPNGAKISSCFPMMLSTCWSKGGLEGGHSMHQPVCTLAVMHHDPSSSFQPVST